MKDEHRPMMDAPVDEYRRSFADERHSWIHYRTWAIAKLFCDLKDGPANKKKFKSDIENVLTGAFGEWVRRIVLSVNRVPPDEFLWDAWKQCEDEVEFEFAARFLQPIDGTFDRTQAALAALKSLRKDEPHNQKVAIQYLKKKQHTVAKMVPLPRDKIDEFFCWIEEVMQVAIRNQASNESFKTSYEKRYGRKRAKRLTGPTRKKP